jgi:two-component system cell cycle response regulator DivK
MVGSSQGGCHSHLYRETRVKRVAVVEDNPDNRLLVAVILEDRYDITEYENGVDALQGFVTHVPDLILLDISLPGMDGVEVLSHIRADERFKHLPVIAITAHASPADRERFLEAGFNEYVAKPIVDEMILLDAIAKHLNA